MKPYTAIDLFCGAGGVSQALKEHFNILRAVEYDPIIAKTYELNHGSDHLEVKDIRHISNNDWIQLRDRLGSQLDLLVGTPPCQGFSKHARKKSSENNDDRNKLIFEIIGVSDIFQPRFLLFENVTNVINFKHFRIFVNMLANLRPDGTPRKSNRPSYHIRFEKIDTSDYDVPQKRKRLILLAKKIETFPAPDAVLTVSKNSIPEIVNPLNIWPETKKSPTLREVFSKYTLRPLQAGTTDKDDLLHSCRNLDPINLLRINKTPKNGGSRKDWPPELQQLKCHQKEKVSFGDVYGRMNFDSYAPTITCGCLSYSKGRFGHPEEDRAISLREAAIIQTFPIDYKFTGRITGEPNEGSKDNIATQIGNAVPVNLAKAFIAEIARQLEQERDTR